MVCFVILITIEKFYVLGHPSKNTIMFIYLMLRFFRSTVSAHLKQLFLRCHFLRDLFYWSCPQPKTLQRRFATSFHYRPHMLSHVQFWKYVAFQTLQVALEEEGFHIQILLQIHVCVIKMMKLHSVLMTVVS